MKVNTKKNVDGKEKGSKSGITEWKIIKSNKGQRRGDERNGS